MANTRIKTVESEYGEAEIKVTDCDSCGNTVGYDKTEKFTIGDREGRACNHCVNEGPIDFPGSMFSLFSFGTDGSGYSFPLNLIGFPLIFVASIIDVLTMNSDDMDEFNRGYGWACLLTFIWFAIIAFALSFGIWQML